MASDPQTRPDFLSGIPRHQQARTALMRFGFGPKRDGKPDFWETDFAGYDACIRELDAPAAATINDIDLDSAGVGYSRLLSADEVSVLANGQMAVGYNFSQEMRARYAKHILYRVGFVERLVMFWLNHFNMSLASPTVTAFAGLVEREVIRACTLGRFETMLLGVCQNPAMLTYLSGRMSTKFNTNQNFAREILELHTVGSNSNSTDPSGSKNYSQNDVKALASILTGWGVVHSASDLVNAVRNPAPACPKVGLYTFNPYYHAEGSYTVLGKTYSQPGVLKGIAVLKDLARNRHTSEHLAREMLRHFVMDEPDGDSIRVLADTYDQTNGNLKEMARAMLNLEVSWTTPLNRIRQPYPWFISMMRALGVPHLALMNVTQGSSITFQDAIDGNGGYLQVLGQMPWTWRTPDGFPDRNSYWQNGSALRLRANVAYSFLSRMKVFPTGKGTTMVTTVNGVDGGRIQDGTLLKAVPQTPAFAWWTMPKAVNLATNVWGCRLSPETYKAVTSVAETDNIQALALLFSSPDYLLA